MTVLTRVTLSLMALALCLAPESQAVGTPRVKGYVAVVPTETVQAREARHRKVAERRQGPAVMVHRGAWAFAPENTLEAYAAAMDYGADGCEVDLRRTADGVLVLFHDDMLDHLTDGFGTVNQLTYYELLSLRPRFVYGTATAETRPPTFAALLALARQRAMLLHLDIKEPGLEGDIARDLEAADCWDQVVAVNSANAPALAKDTRIRLLAYKAPGLYDGRRDIDPAAVREALARPGQMIMVDDPRVAARELKRAPYQPVPLPAGLRWDWSPTATRLAPETGSVPMAFLASFRGREAAARGKQEIPPARLMDLLSSHPEERSQPEGLPEYRQQRTEHILARAWAAQQLGTLGRRSPRPMRLLEELVRHRSLHPDWMYHGLDGAMAARALGMLGATEAVPSLTAAFMRVDPELRKVVNPQFAQNPLAWTDFRTKMYILPALGQLRCPASKRFLMDYLAMPEEKAREIAPLLYEDATRALFEQDLSRAEIEALLKNPHPSVRGAALLICLDRPTPARTAAIRASARWASDLPQARAAGSR